MTKAKLTLICLLAVLQAGAVLAETRTERADAIRKNAAVKFTGQYDVACPVPVAKAAMQRPLMMGMLWDSYMYGPGYKVSSLGESGAVHVVDPSGIVGDVWPVSTTGNTLVYVAQGKINHWAVPVLNDGSAVFDVGLAPNGAGTRVTVSVSLKPENQLASAALWMLTPVVKARINSRVTNNVRDAGTILRDISTTPQAVAARLQGDMKLDFERVFLR